MYVHKVNQELLFSDLRQVLLYRCTYSDAEISYQVSCPPPLMPVSCVRTSRVRILTTGDRNNLISGQRSLRGAMNISTLPNAISVTECYKL